MEKLKAADQHQLSEALRHAYEKRRDTRGRAQNGQNETVSKFQEFFMEVKRDAWQNLWLAGV